MKTLNKVKKYQVTMTATSSVTFNIDVPEGDEDEVYEAISNVPEKDLLWALIADLTTEQSTVDWTVDDYSEITK